MVLLTMALLAMALLTMALFTITLLTMALPTHYGTTYDGTTYYGTTCYCSRQAATDLRQKLKTAEADVARLREQLARAPQGTRPLSARVVKGQGRDTRRN